MNYRIILIALAFLMSTTCSFAQSESRDKVKAYQELILGYVHSLSDRMEEQTNALLIGQYNPDELINYVDEIINELTSLEVVDDVKVHRQLYIKYLNAYKTQFRAMENLDSEEDIKLLNIASQEVTSLYKRITKIEEGLCEKFDIPCEK